MRPLQESALSADNTGRLYSVLFNAGHNSERVCAMDVTNDANTHCNQSTQCDLGNDLDTLGASVIVRVNEQL